MAISSTLRLITLKLRNSRFAKSFKYMALMMYVAIMVLVATYIFNKSHDLLRTNNKMPVAVEKVGARDNEVGDEVPRQVLEFEGLVRPGLGENGRGVVLSQEQTGSDIQAQMKLYSYNKYVSDRITVKRLLPDTRHRECRSIDYDRSLPKASVILIFCNETLSALMRTVHSVIDQTPAELLHEVVLIDDGSGSEEITQVWKDVIYV